jgi:hypothetical protein
MFRAAADSITIKRKLLIRRIVWVIAFLYSSPTFVSGTALAAGAWTSDRRASMRSVLRCIYGINIVAREEPVASAIPLTCVGELCFMRSYPLNCEPIRHALKPQNYRTPSC